MKNLFIQEEFVNVTEGFRCGDSGVFESRFTSKGEAFRHYRKTYGRPVSRVYIGEKNPRAIGWVFRKRQKYDDSRETFLQETWITLHKAPPDHHTIYHYNYLH